MSSTQGPAEAPLISVVVPVYNAEDTLGRTLEALAAQRCEHPFEVLVVDGGSSDASREIIARHRGRWPHSGGFTLVDNPLREPANARNLGGRQAVADFLAFTDADCEPDPDWLQAGVRRLAEADIVQGMVLPEDWVGPFDRSLAVTSEYGLYETANLFVRREIFERAGGFEPLPGLRLPDGTHFGEDAWFVWRARRLGARTTFGAEAIVRHAVVRRGLRPYLSEIARRRYFPRLVKLIPELRGAFLHRRLFLSPQQASFDLALIGMLLALGTRRPPLLVLATPLAHRTVSEAAQWPLRQRPRVVGGRLCADALTLAALVQGSASARTLVL